MIYSFKKSPYYKDLKLFPMDIIHELRRGGSSLRGGELAQWFRQGILQTSFSSCLSPGVVHNLPKLINSLNIQIETKQHKAL